MDGLADLEISADDVENGRHFVFTLLDEGVYVALEVSQLLGQSGVEGYHGTGAVGLRTHGAELEAVAGEGEGAGAVAVGVVDEQFGYLRDVQLHALLAAQADEFVLVALLDMCQHLRELLAEEGGDDGGWCLVSAQTVCISSTGDAGLQQTVVAVDGHQRVHDEGNEAQVLFGCLAWSHEQYTRIGT